MGKHEKGHTPPSSPQSPSSIQAVPTGPASVTTTGGPSEFQGGYVPPTSPVIRQSPPIQPAPARNRGELELFTMTDHTRDTTPLFPATSGQPVRYIKDGHPEHYGAIPPPSPLVPAIEMATQSNQGQQTQSTAITTPDSTRGHVPPSTLQVPQQQSQSNPSSGGK